MLRGHWLYLAGINEGFDIERYRAVQAEVSEALAAGWDVDRDGRWVRL